MIAATVATSGVATPARAAPGDMSSEELSEELEKEAFVDPRKAPWPRRHRFRLGLQLDYVRLSAAVDAETGETQRFHYIPLQIDAAYQLQFAKVLMVRPSFAMGLNTGNTLEAMPFIIHPQIYSGYQGRMFGAAFGYGFFFAPDQQKDGVSDSRGGLGQPVIRNNHHIAGEVSLTTRVHKRREAAPGAGQLSLQLRVGAVKSTTLHYELNVRRWRAMVMFNAGWYFGDGKRARARRQQRRRERDRRRATAG
jgi:hypothetical protein